MEGGIGKLNAVKVLMTQKIYSTGTSLIREYAKDGIENGYSLFGIIHPNKVYEIKKIIPAGRRSERSGVSFSTDKEAIQNELRKELQLNPNIRYFGDNHSHPWKTDPYPSGIDINQLMEARVERPYTIIGVHSLSKLKFFGLDENGDAIEIPYQIIPDDFSESRLLARIQEITDNEKIKQKKVAVLGCGSLSCGLVQSLAGGGLRDFLLGDMDKFGDVNVIRHLGGIYDLGREKSEIFKEYIESHNPLARVQCVNDDFLKNRELLRSVIDWSDIIIASSGNPALNYQINIQCVRAKKPCVYGGIFDKAESAYVFYCDPKAEQTACFDCIFGLTSAAIDNNTITRKYGLADGEIKEAQGMFADILTPGAMMAKCAIWLLMGEKKNFNLVRYYNDLKVERYNVAQKKGCATCDYINWVKGEEEKIEPKGLNLFDQFWENTRNFWRKFGFGI